VRMAAHGPSSRAPCVTLPAGRVFFSCACWESKAALPDGLSDGEITMPGRDEPAGVVAGPGGVFLLDKGGLTVKRQNGPLNLWGALGETMLILGRYSLSATNVAATDASADAAASPTTAPPASADSAEAGRAAGAEATPDGAEDALAAARKALSEREAKLEEREEALRKALGSDSSAL